MLVKIYGNVAPGAERYSPAACMGAQVVPISDEPDMAHVSTSYVERQNLTMRMSMRRFTRLTNGFSKKAENLSHAVALQFMHYNLPRASDAPRDARHGRGLSDHVWELADLLALMPEPVRAAWGSKKQAAIA
jgi:hypothetical protein